MDIFGPNANLSGIVLQNNSRISNVVHKAKIEVNEQGTRAAAATGAVVIPLMGPSTLKIVANHPFIFFIYHKESLNIIFEGLYIEPTQLTQATLPLKSIGKDVFKQRYNPASLTHTSYDDY